MRVPDRARTASRIRSSVSVSTEEKASSRTRNGASARSARASAVRCFWPPESVMPRSPTIVSSPFGKVARSVPRPASTAARSTSARVVPGRPIAMLAASVSEKRNVSCGTATTVRRRSGSGISRRSRPPRRTVPNGGSSRRRRRFRSVDFPAPVRPTRATVVPGSRARETSLRTGASPSYENVRPATSSVPPGSGPSPLSSGRGAAAQRSAIRFQEAEPRCQRFTTQPRAIAGQTSSTR